VKPNPSFPIGARKADFQKNYRRSWTSIGEFPSNPSSQAV
jgi:hypothetical protein